MTYVLGQIVKLIGLLNSERSTTAIAIGFSLGMILGFTPFNFVFITVFFFFFCILKINGAAVFLAWAVFEILAFVLDPLFDQVGYFLLADVSALRPLWTMLYNAPVLPWTRFNNSVVMGGLATGVILFVPAVFFFKWLIRRYRESVVKRITNAKWFKAFKATGLYKIYQKYAGIRETFS